MSFMNAAMDTLLVAQTFCTLAEEAGLGICLSLIHISGGKKIILNMPGRQVAFWINMVIHFVVDV